MRKYFQTATGYGYIDGGDIPSGSTEITEAEYNALATADEQAAEQARQAEVAALRQRWTTVRDDLVASGVTAATAEILADAVGIRPSA